MNVVETLKLIGRPNAYYPKLAKPLGGVNPAVLFSQLFYWQDKATSDLGVYKTRDELEEETGLSHNEQRTAIKKLQEKGVLIVTEKRLDHKTFYKIDNAKVNEILANFAESINQSSRSEESNHPEVDNVEFGETTKSSSLDQEITTKNTTETTTQNIISGFDFSALNGSLEKNLIDDFIKFRKSIKKPVTQGAINYLIRELNKAVREGHNANELIEMTLSRGWQTFEYRYLNHQQQSPNGTPPKFMTLAERNRAVLESMRG